MCLFFAKEEFKCPCCGLSYVDDKLIKMLNKARKIAGIPFIINSGFRCGEHNKNIGGYPTSSHMTGLAADIKCKNSKDRLIMLKALIEAKFNRIGIGNTFIHVDCDNSKTSDRIWTY